LGVEASDAGVELGSLIVVDPPGRYPFRQTVGVHPAGPALLQEVGVVIPTEQGQIANTALRVPSAVLREPAFRAPLGGPGSRSHRCPGPRRTEPAVTQSSPRTTLAEGAITQSGYLVIELVAPQRTPANDHDPLACSGDARTTCGVRRDREQDHANNRPGQH
jgi:hypothetical protein